MRFVTCSGGCRCAAERRSSSSSTEHLTPRDGFAHCSRSIPQCPSRNLTISSRSSEAPST